MSVSGSIKDQARAAIQPSMTARAWRELIGAAEIAATARTASRRINALVPMVLRDIAIPHAVRPDQIAALLLRLNPPPSCK